MGLNEYRLGDLIEYCDIRNSEYHFSELHVRGISNTKELMPTKADLLNRTLDDFKVVFPNEFVFNRRTTRMGEKFAITFNNTSTPVIVTNDYVVFKVIKKDILLNEYLFMLFNRPEFDRYVRFNSWGSATEMFVWENMCDVVITLPSITKQRKYVDVYLALQNNLATYQSKVEELKIVCDGYLDNLKRTTPATRLRDYIVQYDERNIDGIYSVDAVRGISTEKSFIDTKANMNGVSLDSYKVVYKNTFVYVPDTSRRGDKMAIALNLEDKPILVSSIYTTFRSKNLEKLLPQYLFMFFDRSKFDRYTRFNSWGSAREVFTMDDMEEVTIPIPDISVQQEIVNIYKCYIERQRIANALTEQLKKICPVLIRGSLKI